MQKRVIVVVDSDPRQSHRPAEALRLAAGLAAWRPMELTVCLMGPASALLGNTAELIGEDDIRMARPVLEEAGVGVFAEISLPREEMEMGNVQEINATKFARILTGADYSIRF